MRSWKLFFLLMFIQAGAYAQSFNDNFDNGNLSTPPWRVEGHNVSISSKESLSGSHSFRAYLPAQTYSNARSEIRFNGIGDVPKHQTLLTTWGAMVAIYVPSNFKPDYTSNEIIIQYHGKQDSHDTYTNPPFAVYLSGYDLRTTVRWVKRDPGTNADKETSVYTNGKIVPGKWNYFVVDINWDYRAAGNGFAKVYMKAGSPPSASDLIAHHNGPIGSKDDQGPYFKLGIYKWDWKKSDRVKKSKDSGVQYRELYYDNVKIQKGAIMGSQTASNQAPSVSISGPGTLTLPTNSTSFTANASDSDGSIKSFTWSKVSGPSASMSGMSGSRLNVSNLVAGTYKFKVVVKDNDGASNSSTATVVVNSSSTSPPSTEISVNAGQDFSVPVADKNFRIEASWETPNANVNSFQWRKISGPNVMLSNADNYRLLVSSIKTGSYEFEIEIKDSKNRIAKDRVRVNVTDGSNENPTVSAGSDKTIAAGNSVTFTASASDSDGSVSSYKWSKVSGPGVSMSNTSGNKMTVNNCVAGSYEFKVTVTDNNGATASDNVKLTVNTSTSGISVSAGADFMVPKADKNFRIQADWDTPNADVKTFQWKKISGPNVMISNDDSYRVLVSSIKTGEYVFEIKITDTMNRTATDRVKVVVTEGVASEASPSDLAELQKTNVQNFTTDADTISLVSGVSKKMKVKLQNVNGVKLSIDKFEGELNTESLNDGIYQYDVVGENGETIQKGTILVY